ncbi:metallophosphoesterase [Telmatocola sphagniphila]|uniref:Metallophosphoesterase n=1 Tax=Telmatocola sphagniphila TaxID=1123043 RepID=A0A8E6B7K6_9BACT|nr:metallophosphoesterase [Telmatocola sphagniphila]QVL31880.1 metallophosphoesterase [Telmatocola sphagniphila]
MQISKILSRRRFLGASVTTLAGLGIYGWQVEPHWVKIVEHPLPLKDAPGSWIGRRIVQISDPHVGALVDSDYLISALKKVNELKPDLVLVTGDWMSCWNRDVPVPEVARVFAHLDKPPLGIVGILGNHDYGGENRNDVRLADRLSDQLAADGVTVLRNQAKEIDGVTFIGLDEYWAHRFDTKPVADHLGKPGPKLALVHNPDTCDLPQWYGYDGWIFCGHTHGGQCKSPFLPPFILPVQNHRYTAGIFDLYDGRTLHINPGLGYVRKIRFNVRPEISIFTVQAAT